MEGRYVFTVSEMNQFIKELLDNVPPLQEVLLRGEISNYKVYPSGHHYFTLKDSQSSLKCLFQSQRLRQHIALGILGFDALKEGHCALVVFEPRSAEFGGAKKSVIGKAAVCMAHGNGFVTFYGLAGIGFGKGAAGKFFKAFRSAEEGGGAIGPAGVGIIN